MLTDTKTINDLKQKLKEQRKEVLTAAMKDLKKVMSDKTGTASAYWIVEKVIQKHIDNKKGQEK
jgi:hypothetical protein